MGMISEFREFAIKGNFLDLAVGVVIGAAFGATTKSFTDDLINPVIGLFTGGADLKNQFVVLKPDGGEYPSLAAAQEAGAITLNWGNFINSIINLLIVAFVMFLIVKAYNRARTAMEEPEEEAPAEPSEDIKLLREIRDSLKASN